MLRCSFPFLEEFYAFDGRRDGDCFELFRIERFTHLIEHLKNEHKKTYAICRSMLHRLFNYTVTSGVGS